LLKLENMVVKLSRVKSKVKGNQYSRIRSYRMNFLLNYTSGHTWSEIYQKALGFGVTERTANSYINQLKIYLVKHKLISSSKYYDTVSIN